MTFYHIAVIINSFLEENNIIYDVWDCPGRGRWIVTGLSRLNWNSKQSWDIRKLLASQPNIAIKSGDMPLREIHLWKLSWAGLHCQFSIWHKSYFEWTTQRGTALNVSPWRAIWASLLLFQPPLIKNYIANYHLLVYILFQSSANVHIKLFSTTDAFRLHLLHTKMILMLFVHFNFFWLCLMNV